MIADTTCSFEVRDGKVFCVTHGVNARKAELKSELDHEADDTTEEHDSHENHLVPFRHILYTASVCSCGVVFIDSEV